MRRKSAFGVLFALAIGLVAGPLQAETLSGIPAAFVDIGLGIRPLGMGGAYVAIADGENGARWNPAALAHQQQLSAGFTWTKQMNMIPYNYLAGNLPFRRMGVGFYIENAGDDVLMENTVGIGGGVTGDRLFGQAWEDFSIGATVKLRWASFGNNDDGGVGQVTGDAIGVGFDIGLYYSVPFVRGLSAGVMWRDLYNTMSWDSSVSGRYTENIPKMMTLAVAYRYGTRTLLAFDIQPPLYGDVDPRIALGGEYKLLKIISLRSGIAQNLGTNKINRDLMVGLGVNLRIAGTAMLEAGVSYLFDELNNTPRVGLIFKW